MVAAHNFRQENTIHIMIPAGSKVVVGLIDSDGEFTISLNERELKVEADMPDSDGRVGVIYHERFAEDFDKAKAEVDEVKMTDEGRRNAADQYNKYTAGMEGFGDATAEEDDPNLPTKEEWERTQEETK